jgi:hypothetical protein
MVTLAAGLLLANPAAAQSDDWPTPAELRDTMRAARGWSWGATPTGAWEGGTAIFEDGESLARLSEGPQGLRVVMTFWTDEMLWSWPLSVNNGWTAFNELAERLPVDAPTLTMSRAQIRTGEPGCMDYPIVDGNLMVDVGEADGPFSALVYVAFEQGGDPACEALQAVESVAPELSPDGPVESPAA